MLLHASGEPADCQVGVEAEAKEEGALEDGVVFRRPLLDVEELRGRAGGGRSPGTGVGKQGEEGGKEAGTPGAGKEGSMAATSVRSKDRERLAHIVG